MLSSRGAISLNTILEEVVESRPPALTGKGRVLLHTEATKMWSVICRVLRAQLIQNHNLILPFKTMGFFFKKKEVVRDGENKYWARTCHLGFHDAFVTRFGIDQGGNVPRIDIGREEFIKFPLEYVAEEVRQPLEWVATFFNELFLCIGESLFRGRLLQIPFEGVATLLVKKEKAAWSFFDDFKSDIFAIDSRKWPNAVREVGQRTLSAIASSGRPGSASSNRPTSARSNSSRPSSAQPRPRSSSSRPASGRPVSSRHADPAAPVEEKKAFLTAATTGKTFEEILKLKKKREEYANKIQNAKNNRKPLRGVVVAPQQQLNEPEESIYNRPQSQQQAVGSFVQPTPRAVLGDLADNEEESVYSVLSPSRQRDPLAAATMRPGEVAAVNSQVPVVGNNDSVVDDDDGYEYVEEPVSTSSQAQNAPRPWQMQTLRPGNLDPKALGVNDDDKETTGGDGLEEENITNLVASSSAQQQTLRPCSRRSSRSVGQGHHVHFPGASHFAPKPVVEIPEEESNLGEEIGGGGGEDHSITSPTVQPRATPLAEKPNGPQFPAPTAASHFMLEGTTMITKSSANTTAAAQQGTSSFFMGGTAPERPASGRRRFQNNTASLQQVKSLLQA